LRLQPLTPQRYEKVPAVLARRRPVRGRGDARHVAIARRQPGV